MKRVLGDIISEKLLWTKFILFFVLALGCIALTIGFLGFPNSLIALVAIWASCRAYYFAFYVIEKYVDPTYRFDGLIEFVKHALHRWQTRKTRP